MNTIRFGATNTLSRDVAGQTIASIIANSGIRGALGFGANVQAKINGVPVDGSYSVRFGETVDIENRAQEKAADVTVKITFGATATLTRAFPQYTRVASVLADTQIRAALGFGNGAVAKINGVVVGGDVYVSQGMTIDIETRAQEKAAA